MMGRIGLHGTNVPITSDKAAVRTIDAIEAEESGLLENTEADLSGTVRIQDEPVPLAGGNAAAGGIGFIWCWLAILFAVSVGGCIAYCKSFGKKG